MQQEDIEERRRLRKKRWRRRRNLRIAAWVVLFLFIFLTLRSCFSSREKNPEGSTPSPTAPGSTPEIKKEGETEPNTGGEKRAKAVMIDPGHGGEESPGTVNAGVYEREINLILAGMVREKLEALGYEVLMMREEDVYISPQNRAVTADASGADILVSIHHNALENDTVTHGMETLYNEKANKLNEELAKNVQSETAAVTNAKNRGIVKDTKVLILREVSIPACLIEVGFLTEKNERARLVSPDYQEKVARGIANGIVKYFESIEQGEEKP